MRTFHNNPKIKEDIIAKLRAHHDADEIIKGVYWENGKGCAVGCTLQGSNHSEYETRFGIPQILARLEDEIFEGLPNQEAKTWPVRFMEAIPVGADLSDIWRQFAIIILSDPDHGVLKLTDFGSQQNLAISKVIELYQTNSKDRAAWEAARAAAWEAGEAAWEAARAAAWEARVAARAAAWEARVAARAAAWEAGEAARAAGVAARAAAWEARVAARAAAWEAGEAAWEARVAARAAAWEAGEAARAAAWEAGEAAWEAHYSWMAERLLDLLRNAPVISETSEDPK